MLGVSLYHLDQFFRAGSANLQQQKSSSAASEMDVLRNLTNSFKNVFLKREESLSNIELYETPIEKPSNALIEFCQKISSAEDATPLANSLCQALMNSIYWQQLQNGQPVPKFSLIQEKIEAIFVENIGRKEAILCLLNEKCYHN